MSLWGVFRKPHCIVTYTEVTPCSADVDLSTLVLRFHRDKVSRFPEYYFSSIRSFLKYALFYFSLGIHPNTTARFQRQGIRQTPIHSCRIFECIRVDFLAVLY